MSESKKLSDQLMDALKAQGDEYGLFGWSDELEDCIDGARLLEERLDASRAREDELCKLNNELQKRIDELEQRRDVMQADAALQARREALEWALQGELKWHYNGKWATCIRAELAKLDSPNKDGV